MAGLASVWLNYVELAPRLHSVCQVSTAIIMQLWAFISLRPLVTPSASFLRNASIITSTPLRTLFSTIFFGRHWLLVSLPHAGLLYFFLFNVFLYVGVMCRARVQWCVCVSWEWLCVQSLVPKKYTPSKKKKKKELHTQIRQSAIKKTHSCPLSLTSCESPSSLCLRSTPNASPLCTGVTAAFKYLALKQTWVKLCELCAFLN